MTDRVDLYRNIHKGIRTMLLDLVAKAGRTDFADAAAVAALRADTRDIFELLESHAHIEDTHLMPHLRQHAPSAARVFDAAHEDQEARLPALLRALESIDTKASDAPRKGHLFVVHLSRIAGELLTHMADEEIDINGALWEAMTDDELHAVERKLVGSIAPEKMARYLRWMLPSMNHPERVTFLSEVPPQVAGFALEIGRGVLPATDHDALAAAIEPRLATA